MYGSHSLHQSLSFISLFTINNFGQFSVPPSITLGLYLIRPYVGNFIFLRSPAAAFPPSQFCRVSHFLPISTRELLISSLILPHFDYGCVVYRRLTGELVEDFINCFVHFISALQKESYVADMYFSLKGLHPSFALSSTQRYLPTYIYDLTFRYLVHYHHFQLF